MTRLKELRTSLKNTQGDIASIVGVTRAAYTNIENGRRQPDNVMLAKLAAYFDVSTDYLLGLTDEKKAYPSNDEHANVDPKTLEIIRLFSQLNITQTEQAMDYLRFLLSKESKENQS